MLTFAIAIPNLNQSHFLSAALESLRQQSKPFNLALVDGGSTDNFAEVIEPYSDMIGLLQSEPDAGQAAAIRDGLDRIPGNIVAWLNADDYYFADTLTRVAHYFEKDQQVDVIYGDAVHVSSAGHFLSYFPAIQEFNAKDLTRVNFICQPACFVRRRAYEKAGKVDPALHYTMDWDLWCRLAACGAKFRYVNEVLAAVRYYPGTKTLSGTRRRYQEIHRVERTYGKRLLPLSWFGYHYFDLMFKAKRTILEQAYYNSLSLVRHLKQSFQHSRNRNLTGNETNYGFHRVEPIVDGRGIIHLPWYDKRQWRKIYLKLRPINNRYRIYINENLCNYRQIDEEYLEVETPVLKEANRNILIEDLDNSKWEFLGLSWDLKEE